MIIPDHLYTARELTVCGLLGGMCRARVRTFLNIGMNRPHNPANNWWLKICQANGILPYVLEVFEPNRRALREYGIPNVIAGDVSEIDSIFGPSSFDVVLWWHGPEHVEKSVAIQTIEKLKGCTRQMLIVGCPKGFEPQTTVGGNDHERHVSAWERSDFEKQGMETIVVHDGRAFLHITAWLVVNRPLEK